MRRSVALLRQIHLRGFTLLELIVTIVILAVLAVVAIPTFAMVIQKSQDETTRTTLEAIGRDVQALAALDQENLVGVAPTAITEVTYSAFTEGTTANAVQTKLRPVEVSAPVGDAKPALPSKGEVVYYEENSVLYLAMLSPSTRLCDVSITKVGGERAECGDKVELDENGNPIGGTSGDGSTGVPTPTPTTTTPEPTPTITEDPLPPAAPAPAENLTGNGVGKVAELSWTSAANPGAYVVYRNGAKRATLAGTVRTYTDTGVVVGRSYAYYVVAASSSISSALVSAPSNTVSITPLATATAAEAWELTTLAGNGVSTNTEGVGTAASLRTPNALTSLGGKLYMATGPSISTYDPVTGAVSLWHTMPSPLSSENVKAITSNGENLWYIRSTTTRSSIVKVSPSGSVLNTWPLPTVYYAGLALEYSPQTGLLYGITTASGSSAATLFSFDPATGLLTDIDKSNSSLGGIWLDGTSLYVLGSAGVRLYNIQSKTMSSFLSWPRDPKPLHADKITGTSTDIYLTSGTGTMLWKANRAGSPTLTFLAGNGSSGYADDIGSDAFLSSSGIHVLNNVVYFTDESSRRLRKAAPSTQTLGSWQGINPEVELTAGAGAVSTFRDPTNSALPLDLHRPAGAVVAGEHVYVGARNGVQKIHLTTGVATTLAGPTTGTTGGLVDAPVGANARFTSPKVQATDGKYLYVSSAQSVSFNVLRRVNLATGATITLTTSAADVELVAVAPSGQFWVADNSGPVSLLDAQTQTLSAASNPVSGSSDLMVGLTGNEQYVYAIFRSGKIFRADWSVEGAKPSDLQLIRSGSLLPTAGSNTNATSAALSGDALYVSDSTRVARLDLTNIDQQAALVAGNYSMVSSSTATDMGDGTGLGAAFKDISGITPVADGLLVTQSSLAGRLRKIVQGAPETPGYQAQELSTTLSLAASTEPVAGDGTASYVAATNKTGGPNVGVSFQGKTYFALGAGTNSKMFRMDAANTLEDVTPSYTPSTVSSMDTDGKWIYLSAGNDVYRYNPVTKQQSHLVNFSSSVIVTVGANGRLYVLDKNSRALYLFDANRHQLALVLQAPVAYTSMQGTPEGIYFASATQVDLLPTGSTQFSAVATLVASGNSVTSMVSSGGHLYIGRTAVVQRVTKATGAATNVAGTGTAGYLTGAGDVARLNGSQYVWTDGATLYTGDYGNNRLRELK